MAENSSRRKRRGRRVYSDQLKAEAVRMLRGGHPAASVAANLGLSSVGLLYRWKAKLARLNGAASANLENRVRQLERQLRHVERGEGCTGQAATMWARSADGWLSMHPPLPATAMTRTLTPGAHPYLRTKKLGTGSVFGSLDAALP